MFNDEHTRGQQMDYLSVELSLCIFPISVRTTCVHINLPSSIDLSLILNPQMYPVNVIQICLLIYWAHNKTVTIWLNFAQHTEITTIVCQGDSQGIVTSAYCILFSIKLTCFPGLKNTQKHARLNIIDEYVQMLKRVYTAQFFQGLS